ncbi:hypothetical protein GF359_04095, partial [candidate division WOR-3 bacterium]|nr:hypothetical protein [candidate division WOR-3 bacterium]MBD3364379.1 hypothetical protein [candidate division WOR-3 bacterium]
MPQLVKGGKYVFGWSQVTEEGRIMIPPEAFAEYKLEGCGKVILMSGSRRSGGFGLTTVDRIKDTPIGQVLDELPELASCSIPEGEPLSKKSRTYCWIRLTSEGRFTVPPDTLRIYGIEPGQKVLVARGSGLVLGFPARGTYSRGSKKASRVGSILERKSMKAEKAKNLFSQGFNCAQAVFSTYAPDLGLDARTALKIASGFGG